MKVFLATSNTGKIDRFKKLLEHAVAGIEVFTPQSLHIASIEVDETGSTLAENAKLKASAYFGKVDMPILANDTGFYVEGEGFIDTPKRIALGDSNETILSNEAISNKVLEFWKGIATKHGGKVDAAWIESFVVMFPNGKVSEESARREVILTDKEWGVPPLQMPVRALYVSKITNKPAIQHTKEAEISEMQPIIDALTTVLLD